MQFFVGVSIINAQASKEQVSQRIEQLRAQKIAFITQQLQLSPLEAQLFWPVYNEFVLKKEEISNQQKQLADQLNKGWSDFTDKQKEDVADKLIQSRVNLAKLEADYHMRFKQVLPISKVLKLYQVENQFKSELIRQLKSQQQQKVNDVRERRKD